MKHRIYTHPQFFEQEVQLLEQLFSMNLPCLHLRKPTASIQEIASILDQIAPEHHPKIIVHEHQELFQNYNLKGLHLKEGQRLEMTEDFLLELIEDYHQKGLTIGTTVHRINTLEKLALEFDYVTLSPVFPSISKRGYKPLENWKVNQSAYFYELVALGGIDMHNLLQAKAKGFSSVAFLGAIWGDLDQTLENYRLSCKKMNYIDRMA